MYKTVGCRKTTIVVIIIKGDSTMAGSNNQKLIPNASNALEQMKYEIASEFGVNLGADTTSRQNGSVGGEITKRLVSYAEQHMAGRVGR